MLPLASTPQCIQLGSQGAKWRPVLWARGPAQLHELMNLSRAGRRRRQSQALSQQLQEAAESRDVSVTAHHAQELGGGAAALVAVSEELVQDDPEAPDIRLARENIVREGLRGVPGGCGQGRLEVRGGAQDGTGAALGEGRRKVGAGGSFPSPGAQFT